MGRPSEGLGEAFSCRLTLEMDDRVRRRQAETGEAKSKIIRGWLADRDSEKLRRREARLEKKAAKARERRAQAKMPLRDSEFALDYEPQIKALAAIVSESLADQASLHIDGDRFESLDMNKEPGQVVFHGQLPMIDDNCDCGSCVARRNAALFDVQLGGL